jgi:hypothetical protein
MKRGMSPIHARIAKLGLGNEATSGAAEKKAKRKSFGGVFNVAIKSTPVTV